MKTPMYVLKKR